MTHADLQGYHIKVEPALVGSYRGRKVYVPHAPTSGPVLLHMLNLLERYDLEGEGRTGLNTHRLVEVIKCRRPSSCFWQSESDNVLFLVGFAARYRTYVGLGRMVDDLIYILGRSSVIRPSRMIPPK